MVTVLLASGQDELPAPLWREFFSAFCHLKEAALKKTVDSICGWTQAATKSETNSEGKLCHKWVHCSNYDFPSSGNGKQQDRFSSSLAIMTTFRDNC